MRKREKYPTRKEALETLAKLIDSNLLSDDMTNDLSDIMECIEEEEEGFFFWGAEVRNFVPDDVHFVHTDKGVFLLYPKGEEKRISRNYDAARFSFPEDTEPRPKGGGYNPL